MKYPVSKTKTRHGSFLQPAEQNLIKNLHNMGKTSKEIAEFIGRSVPNVRRVLDPDFEESTNAVLNLSSNNRKSKFVSFRLHALGQETQAPRQVMEQPQGTFLSSPEGRDTLERYSQGYSAEVSEWFQIRRGRVDRLEDMR